MSRLAKSRLMAESRLLPESQLLPEQLKNLLTAKDPDTKLQCQQCWLAIDPVARMNIKTMVVQALGTEMSRLMAAPQCVAYIASAELPTGQWLNILKLLAINITNSQSTEALKTESLDALSYICEETDTRFLAGHSKDILNAIQGMRREEPSIMVRRSATKALLNSLEFTKVNFEEETERHFIMQVVCEAAQCQDLEVQIAALQNLVKIMSLHYQYMEAYMGPALFAITREAMMSPHDQIALQGIEFWSAVCAEEQDLALKAAEAMKMGRLPENTSFYYVKGALQSLLPILLDTLTKQEELDNEDDWNPCKAARVCLSLMACCTEDTILEPVMSFVNRNLRNSDWKWRDAAVMALGSIMEGPDPDMLVPYLLPVVELVIQLMMDDESVVVKDTSAWTLGHICEQVPSVVIREEVLGKLLVALGSGLEREPRVADNVCWAISSLAEAAYDAATTSDAEPDTYCLSSNFEAMITKLLNTTDRSDAGSNILRPSAYTTLMDLIKYSATDCYPLVQKTTTVIMDRLERVLPIDEQGLVTGGDRQHLSDLESLLCATLQSLLRKLNTDDVVQVSNSVMSAVKRLLDITSALPSGGVQEDAIMTVSVLVESIGEDFLIHVNSFYPFLKTALMKFSDPTVCLSAVGLVGNLCRALNSKIAPYCDSIMEIFMGVLSHMEVHLSVKPPILSAVGDIAMAIGTDFRKYLDVILPILQQVSNLQVDKHMIEYRNELREGCIEAYTGIVQGLKGDKEGIVNSDVNLVFPHVPGVLDFLNSIATDEDRSESNTACCAGLLGDLLEVFGTQLVPELPSRPAIQALLGEGRQSRDKKTRTVSLWTSKLLKSLQNEQAGSKGKGKGSVIQ